MASPEPKLFCGVAVRMKGADPSSARALEQLAKETGRDACDYATILVKRLFKTTAGQRLHTDRTNWTLHCTIQTVSPKRETIRGRALTVKPRGAVQG